MTDRPQVAPTDTFIVPCGRGKSNRGLCICRWRICRNGTIHGPCNERFRRGEPCSPARCNPLIFNHIPANSYNFPRIRLQLFNIFGPFCAGEQCSPLRLRVPLNRWIGYRDAKAYQDKLPAWAVHSNVEIVTILRKYVGRGLQKLAEHGRISQN